KRTSCGAAVVAAIRGWWRRGVGCDEVMMGTMMRGHAGEGGYGVVAVGCGYNSQDGGGCGW
nr:hypothetical protein [Tanacetum cinerariifolium]